MADTETRTSLIRRVRNPADAESWREFATIYEPLLLSYVRSRGVPEQDARDLVQDIFAVLVKTLSHFELDHERGRFRTWLWRVTSNAITDWARREQRRRKAEGKWREDLVARFSVQDHEPDEEWEAAHRKLAFDLARKDTHAETQPKTWACFELHLLEGRPSEQVAVALGLTVNSVNVNSSRVRARVKARYDQYMRELN